MSNKYISLPEVQNGESLTRALIKMMAKQRKTTLTKIVQTFNQLHPDRQTTTQNTSNKLARNTIQFMEMVELAEACGYVFCLMDATEAAKAPVKKFQPGDPLPDTAFLQKFTEGSAICKSINHSNILIAGRNAAAAKEWIEATLSEGMTQAVEYTVIAMANSKFDVIAKPAEYEQF